jgi:hypothetical protein
VEQRDGIAYERIAAVYHWFAAQETTKDLEDLGTDGSAHTDALGQ